MDRLAQDKKQARCPACFSAKKSRLNLKRRL